MKVPVAVTAAEVVRRAAEQVARNCSGAESKELQLMCVTRSTSGGDCSRCCPAGGCAGGLAGTTLAVCAALAEKKKTNGGHQRDEHRRWSLRLRGAGRGGRALWIPSVA
jgi:hypothetical protein